MPLVKIRKGTVGSAVVVQVFKPSTLEAEAGKSL